jgi:hypothetical protein
MDQPAIHDSLCKREDDDVTALMPLQYQGKGHDEIREQASAWDMVFE